MKLMDKMIENVWFIPIKNQDERKETEAIAVKEDIEELTVSRWNQYCSPLHVVAFILDPKFQHKGFSLVAYNEVVCGWNEILRKLSPLEELWKVRDALGSYRNKEGFLGWEDAQQDR